MTTKEICEKFVEENIHNSENLAVAIVVADGKGCTVHVCSGLPFEAEQRLVLELIENRINQLSQEDRVIKGN